MDRKDASTNKFTNMDAKALAASMAKFEGECALATVNDDGSPNAALFMPCMVDESHVVFVLAPNRTRENVERTGLAWAVYVVASPAAEEKAQRHAGARLRLSLVRNEGETADEYQAVAEKFPRMNPYVLVFRIEEILPVG